jgi:hypothetical protein
LERRALLSVTVSVVSGTLVVTGDSNANVVAIDQVDTSGTSGTVTPGSFLITPGAKTALNGGTAGAALTLSGATAGIQVNLGAGNDSLDMQGVAGQPLSPFAISITPGTGHNTIRIADFSVSTVSIVCANKGSDSVEIDDTAIDGGATAGTTPALILQAQQGYASAVLAGDDIGPTPTPGTSFSFGVGRSSNFALAIRDTTFNGGLTATMDKSGGAVQLENSTIAGALSVTSLGPGNVTLDQFQADSGFIKIGSLPSNQSSVDVSGGQVTHKLDIETTGTTDGSVENSRGGEIYLKLDGILADLASDSGAANGTVGGVLTVSTHGTIHKAEVHDISFDSFTLKMGSSAADRSVLDVSGSQVTHKLDIESAVGRMSCTAEANTAGDLTLNFAKVEYELTAPVGGVVSQDTLAVSLAPGALSMTADGVQAGGMNLKLTSPSAQTPSNIQLSDINLSGQLKVTSLGPSSFYLGPAKTGSPQTGGGPSFGLLATDMFFTATNLPGPQPGPSQIKLSDAMITGQLQIIGGGNDTIAVAGTSVGGTAQFDGGGGLRNKLNIAGNQFASPPVIVHFATATQ